MRMLTSRAITAAAAVAIALSTMTIQPAAAGSRHGNDAAALAAFAAIFGTVAAIIAAEQQRDSYSYSHGPVYGGPVRRPAAWALQALAATPPSIRAPSVRRRVRVRTRVSPAYGYAAGAALGWRRPVFCAAIRTHVDHNR